MKGFDAVGVPINLKYNNQRFYTSKLGGCFTIFVVMFVLSYLGAMLYNMIENPIFLVETETQYLNPLSNTESFVASNS